MLSKSLNIILISILHFSTGIYALRCYTCSYTSSTTDMACINNPDAVLGTKFTSCSKKYCVIQRQELISPSGKVNTFLRDCQDKPLFLNNVIDDGTFKTYYRSCSTDLCNHGNGITSSGGILDGDAGAGENKVVPGLNSCTKLSIINIHIFMVVILMIFYKLKFCNL